MRTTVIRQNRHAATRGIAERASLGHQAIEVSVLSAVDVAGYSTFMRRLRRPTHGVHAPARTLQPR